MKSYIIFLFCIIVAVLYISCGSDNPVTNITNPPTAADSTIKLYSPLDSSHYFEGDSVIYSWSRGLGAYSYRYYSDSSAQFLQNDYSVISDTVLHGLTYSASFKIFIKIVPIINDTARFQYQSETRIIFFNQ